MLTETPTSAACAGLNAAEPAVIAVRNINLLSLFMVSF
jgi:hypothetical protein